MLKKIESSSLKKFPRSQQTVSSFCHSKPSSVGGRRGRPLVLRRLSSKGSPRASKEFWEEKDVLPSDPLNSSRELPRVETLSSLYAPELHRVVCRTTEEELGLGWFGPIPTPNECVSKKGRETQPTEGGRERKGREHTVYRDGPDGSVVADVCTESLSIVREPKGRVWKANAKTNDGTQSVSALHHRNTTKATDNERRAESERQVEEERR